MWLQVALVVAGVWTVLAVALALLLGRTIGLADRRRRESLRLERPKEEDDGRR